MARSRSPRAVCIVALVAAGCAAVTRRPLPRGDPTAEARTDGIRYLRSAPFLLVVPDGHGRVTTRLLELPDTSRVWVAEPASFLASLDVSLELEDGVLTRGAEEPGARPVPGARIRAASDVLGAAAMLNLPDASQRKLEVPPPRLYRIVTGERGIELVGGAGDAPVRIPWPPETPWR